MSMTIVYIFQNQIFIVNNFQSDFNYKNLQFSNVHTNLQFVAGLDSVVVPYIHSFLNNKVNGQQVLNLGPDDLEHLGVYKLGHQELILEAVEYLRNFVSRNSSISINTAYIG